MWKYFRDFTRFHDFLCSKNYAIESYLYILLQIALLQLLDHEFFSEFKLMTADQEAQHNLQQYTKTFS